MALPGKKYIFIFKSNYYGKAVFYFINYCISLIGFFACNDEPKSKDAVIKADIEKTLKDDPMAANVTVDVKDAVATLSGECMNDNCKEHCTMRVETVVGVRSVVNN